MPAYLIAYIQPTDKAFAEYPPLVPPTLEPYSGKIVLKCFVANGEKKIIRNTRSNIISDLNKYIFVVFARKDIK